MGTNNDFYFEYCEVDKAWSIYESCDSQYDIFLFNCATEEDAIDAVNYLNQLEIV